MLTGDNLNADRDRARQIGRLGGLVGGREGFAAMTPARQREITAKAVAARAKRAEDGR